MKDQTEDTARSIIRQVETTPEKTFQRRAINPHTTPEWRSEQSREAEATGYIRRSLERQDVTVTTDGQVIKVIFDEGCGCCGGEMGEAYRVDRASVANWSLGQM